MSGNDAVAVIFIVVAIVMAMFCAAIRLSPDNETGAEKIYFTLAITALVLATSIKLGVVGLS